MKSFPLPSDLLEILGRKIAPSVELTLPTTKKRFQVFEVLVGRVAELLEKDYRWLVTPAQGDRGIDLIGEKTLFSIPQLSIAAVSIIIGQCKTSRRSINLINSFTGDLAKALHALEERNLPAPTLVLLIAAGPIGDLHRARMLPALAKAATAPVILFDTQDIVQIVAQNLPQVEPLLRKILPTEDANKAIAYFARFKPPLPEVITNSSAPGYVESGRPFDLLVHLSLDRPSQLYLNLKLKLENPPRFLVVSPSEILRRDGIDIVTDAAGKLRIKLMLIGYRPGSWSLGTLSVSTQEGDHLATVPLQRVRVTEAYHPPFYEQPYRAILRDLQELTRRAQTGTVKEVVVSGVGGTGKTRLCQELGIRAIQRDHTDFISISHSQTYDQPVKILRDLLVSLQPEFRVAMAEGDVSDHLRRLSRLDDEIAGGLSLLFASASRASVDELKQRGLVRVLVFALMERLQAAPVILHCSDLHWATQSILGILSEVAEAVRWATSTNSEPKVHGLLLIYEGRIHEASLAEGYSTDAFEYFAKQVGGQDSRAYYEVKPLSREDSDGFMEVLLGVDHAAPLEAPEQSVILRRVVDAAEGNPLYLIEFVRLLRQEGFARYDELTGRHYLVTSLPRQLAIPTTVAALIGRRLAYIRRTTPEIYTFLRAVGLLESEISGELFSALWKRFAPNATLPELAALDMLVIPEKMPGEVRFRHESYFQVVSRLPFDDTDKTATLSTYLDWSKRQTPSAENSFFEARLRQQLSTTTPDEAADLYRQSLFAAQGENNLFLQERVLGYLVELYGRTNLDRQRRFSAYAVRYDLGRLLTLTANWRDAQFHLTSLFQELDSDVFHGTVVTNQREDALLLWAKTGVQLGNTFLHRLKHPQADETLHRLQPFLYTMVRKAPVNHRESWLPVLIECLNRQGVTAWFDGRYEDALKALYSSLRLARENSLIFLEMVQLIDLASVQLHFDRVLAGKVLAAAERMLCDRVTSPKDELMSTLVRAKLQIIEIIQGGGSSRGKELTDICEMLTEVYWEAVRAGYRSEQGTAAFLAGVLSVATESSAALDWFLRGLRVAFAADNLELRWKLHMAITHYGYERGNKDVARVHANLARTLIAEDLEARKPSDRVYRDQLFRPVVKALEAVELWLSQNSKPALSFSEITVALGTGPITVHVRGLPYFIQN